MNLCAGINNTGYGIVATNILKQLYQSDQEYSLFPIGGPVIQDDLTQDAWNAGRRNAQENFSAELPSLKIWHDSNLSDRYSNNFNAALTFWELDTLSADSRKQINSLDHLFVASEWAQEIVIEQCDVNCTVIPMGVDRDIFNHANQQNGKDDTYRFFTLGKTEVRKGHDIIFELFDMAFDPADDVELWVKWDNPFFTDADYKAFRQHYEHTAMYKAGKVKFVSTKTQQEVADFIKQCDCGLFPTRAEGFGLGILEAMACDKPVITTDYSAQAEFAGRGGMRLVEIDELEYAYDGKWFYGQGQWAKIGQRQKDQFVDLMRNYFKSERHVPPPYQLALNRYTWENTLESITEVFKRSQN